MALFYDDPIIIQRLLERRNIPVPDQGQRFGRLVFTGEFCCYLGTENMGFPAKLAAKCKCDCGKPHSVCLISLLRGSSKSCGCLRDEAVAKNGHARATYPAHVMPLVRHLKDIRRGMIERCYDPNYKSWDRYGGRGIKVCEEWKSSLRAFIFWAAENKYRVGLTIDRYPNTDGDYEPINCRWATMEQQNRNKSGLVQVTAWGETKCAAEWADDARCVVKYPTALARIHSGWRPEDAFSLRAWAANRGTNG